jgi:protocatechuate 3,4-dioxygenase beta subunit
MVHQENKNFNRRWFLRSASRFASACGLLAIPNLNAEEPFDSLPQSVWQNARRNGLVMIHRPAPNHMSSRVQITLSNEPGEPLVVAGQVFAPDGRTPVPGMTVYAYNTDMHGYYGENHTEYPPRLFGWMKTDASGRFKLRTIRPGSYPEMQVPAHIHFTLWGAGYPLQWAEELRFEGDPYITSSMLAEDAQCGEFRAIQRITHGDGGVLRCDLKIRVQTESNFH